VDRAQKLLADHPDLVEVAESNAAVVAAADVVFVGLLPATARAELPTLPFRPDQLVISMMAAVDLEEVLALVRLPRARVVRTVPLPSNARRSGPILVHPAGNDEAEALLRVVGCPVVRYVTFRTHVKTFAALSHAVCGAAWQRRCAQRKRK